MFAAIIDNGSTWLLDIRDNLEIREEQLRKEWNKRYIGWLVNVDSMPDIIWGIPISRFMIKLPDDTLEDISVKQAHMVYESLVKLRKDTKTSEYVKTSNK
ncbi:MAG: hypothetical protein ACI4XM_07055 [Candidatus Coprovivens sp.]